MGCSNNTPSAGSLFASRGKLALLVFCRSYRQAQAVAHDGVSTRKRAQSVPPALPVKGSAGLGLFWVASAARLLADSADWPGESDTANSAFVEYDDVGILYVETESRRPQYLVASGGWRNISYPESDVLPIKLSPNDGSSIPSGAGFRKSARG
jgi:hypothetical protein